MCAELGRVLASFTTVIHGYAGTQYLCSFPHAPRSRLCTSERSSWNDSTHESTTVQHPLLHCSSDCKFQSHLASFVRASRSCVYGAVTTDPIVLCTRLHGHAALVALAPFPAAVGDEHFLSSLGVFVPMSAGFDPLSTLTRRERSCSIVS